MFGLGQMDASLYISPSQSSFLKDEAASGKFAIELAIEKFTQLANSLIPENSLDERIKETAHNFLACLKEPGSYTEKTEDEKIYLKLCMILLSADSRPNVSEATFNLLHAIEETKVEPYSNHPVLEMVKAILEEKDNLSVIGDFWGLIDRNDLSVDEKDGISILLFALESKKSLPVEIIISDREKLKPINIIKINLIKLACRSHQKEIWNPMINFFDYARKLQLSKNKEIPGIFNVAFAVANFSCLKNSNDGKIQEIAARFLMYLEDAESYKKLPDPDKNSFQSDVKNLTTVADSDVLKLTRELLNALEKTEIWRDSPMLEMAAVLTSKEENSRAIKSFLDLVSKGERKKKKSDLDKLVLNLSALLKGEKKSIEDGSLRNRINYLMSHLYDQNTGKLRSIIEPAIQSITDALDDLIRLKQWEGKEVNASALEVIGWILALRDFLKLEVPSNVSLTDKQNKEIKNIFLACLKTTQPPEGKDEKELLAWYLEIFAKNPNTTISEPTCQLLKGLINLEIWANFKIADEAKIILRRRAVSLLGSAISKSDQAKQLRTILGNLEQYSMDNNEWKSRYELFTPFTSTIRSEVILSLKKELISLLECSDKQVSLSTKSFIVCIKNEKEWEGALARESVDSIYQSHPSYFSS